MGLIKCNRDRVVFAAFRLAEWDDGAAEREIADPSTRAEAVRADMLFGGQKAADERLAVQLDRTDQIVSCAIGISEILPKPFTSTVMSKATLSPASASTPT